MTSVSSDQSGSRAPELYRYLPDMPRFSLGDNREFFYSPLLQRAEAVPTNAVRLLQGCRTFATLEEHAQRLCGELKLPPERAGGIRKDLAALADAGLLVTQRALRERLARPEAAAAPARITTVGIPTRERVQCLERCLNSLLVAPRTGAPPEYVVVDDSKRPEDRDINRAVLQAMHFRPGIVTWYAGPEAKERYARQLAAQAGVDPAVVAFALLNEDDYPIATGTSRNLLLLHAVGELLLQVDDDVIPRLAPAPDTRPGLALSSQHDPTEFWFPPDHPAPVETFQARDLLAVHEQLLGQELADCVAALAPDAGLDCDRVQASFFRRLGTQGAQVRVTAAGVSGDSGMSSSLFLLLLEGGMRNRLLRSDAVYRATITRRRLACGVTRPTITEGALCLAPNLGLDHRRMLPPFMPVQRNQDGIFGALVKACGIGTYFGYLPWLVRHESPQTRGSGLEELANALAGQRSDRMLHLLIRGLSLRFGGSEERNLRALGTVLADLGTLPVAEFEEVVRLQVWNHVTGLAGQLANLLQRYNGQPAWWASDVRRVLAVVREQLADDLYAVPVDLQQVFGPDEARLRFQILVQRFGKLLQAWPDMVAAARDLREQGIRPAEPV